MEILLKCYAKDSLLVNEVEAYIQSIEKITNENLAFSIGQNGKPFIPTSRLDYIGQGMNTTRRRNIPLITNAKESKMITISGNFLSSNYNYAGTPMWYLVLDLEKKIEPQVLHDFLLLPKTLECYWATTTSGDIEAEFFMQSQPSYFPSSTKDLPKLNFPQTYDSPYIPAVLGWINYWPAPALKRIGFKEQHRALFYSVKEAANDGLILQITKEPLDFDIAEHLRKTVAIYDALPAIGGRDCV